METPWLVAPAFSNRSVGRGAFLPVRHCGYCGPTVLIIAHFDWLPLAGSVVEAQRRHSFSRTTRSGSLRVATGSTAAGSPISPTPDFTGWSPLASMSRRSIATMRGVDVSAPARAWRPRSIRMRWHASTRSIPRCWRRDSPNSHCVFHTAYLRSSLGRSVDRIIRRDLKDADNY